MSVRTDNQPGSSGGAPDDPLTDVLFRSIPVARLTMPRVSVDLLPRAAPRRRLGDWRSKRLITVAAPAGYGKSMFVAELLTAAQDETPAPAVAWLTAQPDDDLLGFVTALVGALRPLLALGTDPVLMAALLRRTETVGDLLLARLAQITKFTVIVVDDLHHLTDAAVLSWLSRAVELSPPSVHWFLLSRQQLPAALARVRLHGDSRDLTASDLMVTRAELSTLLSCDVQQPIADEVIDRLAERIQGWFAALQLARVLAQYSELPPAEALARLPADLHGRQHLLVGYLSSEIITHLPLDLREFLLRCAILPYLQAELCAVVAGMDDAERQLHRLADEHLLISAHDGPAESYVLHQLLREALLNELRRRRSTDQVVGLYRRAADWFVARGEFQTALRTLLDGGLFDAAADLLYRVGRRLFLQTRVSELLQLLRLMPTEQLSGDSDLLQLHVWALFSVGDFTQLAVEMRRLELLCRTRPFRSVESEDDFRALSVLVRMFAPDHEGLRELAAATLTFVQPTSYHAQGWLHLLRVIVARGDESDDPVPSLEASREAFQRADSLLDVVFTTSLQVILLRNSLALDQALRVIREVQQRLEREQRPYLADENGSYLLTLAADIAFWRDDIAGAQAILWRLRASAERHNSVGIQLESYLRLRACALLQPFDEDARQRLAADTRRQDEWWQAVQREATIAVRAQCMLLRIETDYRLGRRERIWPAYQGLGLDQPPEDAPDVIWQVYLAAHVLARRDLERLTPLFEQMRQRYNTRYKQYQYLRLSVWYCLQQLALGQSVRARELLREILPTIDRIGFHRLILELPELGPLLKAVGTRTALSLCEALRAQTPPAVLLSPQQQRMVELLIAGADNARIATEFAITVGTVKWHLNRLYRVLNVRDRRELLERAAAGRLGLTMDD